MAVGRIGGTKSRLSGQVGNEIYSAMRNPDGSYTQVVRTKAESVRYSNTSIQAAQRMVTGMVEGLMNRLAPVAKIAIQDAPNDAWAVNKFSSMNLNLVREDMKNHWYDSDHFSYPFKQKNPADYIQSGGYWRISEGTLKNNLFSFEGEDEYYYRWMKRPVDLYALFYGLKWELTDDICTVGDFLRKYGITRRDLMCFVYWESDDIMHDPEEEPEHIEGYHYIIISVDPMVLDSVPATEENLISLFHVTSDNPYIAQVSLPWVGGNPPTDGLYRFFAIGRAVSTAVNQEEVGWCCGFSVSYASGKKQVSSSTLHGLFDGADAPYQFRPPSMCFGSWVDQYWVRPFPSPFE